MKKPSVSVIMPVYNAERYVAKAVESILGQTFRDFEFIVIDDGSKDGSLRILAKYAEADQRIRLVSRPNTGIVGALNEGIELSRGQYIARMDADDIAMPQRLATQVKYLESHPECVLVGSRALLIDPDGFPIREWCTESTHEEIEAAFFSLGWPIVHPAIIMRRDAILACGGYRKEYETLEDLDLFFRLGERGRLANVPEILLHYRKHFESICHSRVQQQNRIRERIYREVCARRGRELTISSDAFKAGSMTVCDHKRLWGWWALKAGNVRTARRHAAAVLAGHPFSPGSWRLLYCALRGH